jgi:hypothetical protein
LQGRSKNSFPRWETRAAVVENAAEPTQLRCSQAFSARASWDMPLVVAKVADSFAEVLAVGTLGNGWDHRLHAVDGEQHKMPRPFFLWRP